MYLTPVFVSAFLFDGFVFFVLPKKKFPSTTKTQEQQDLLEQTS
jgi:hypothetical protein